jgi:hypothetical protein
MRKRAGHGAIPTPSDRGTLLPIRVLAGRGTGVEALNPVPVHTYIGTGLELPVGRSVP